MRYWLCLFCLLFCIVEIHAKALIKKEIVEITPGMGLKEVAFLLEKKEILNYPRLWIWIVRMKGEEGRLQAGIYAFHPNENFLKILHTLVSGKVMTRNFTLIEGRTVKNVFAKLKHAPFLKKTSFEFTAFNTVYGYVAPSIEGLFFPDTYRYDAGSTAKALLQRAHRKLLTVLGKIWKARDASLPYRTPYELLIAASIIEKEALLDEERALISGVILNRLKKGMRLQMDPTVMYGLKKEYTWTQITRRDLNIDTPYNTYKHTGLPPTPISMPGLKSLYAAAHPYKTEALYFVALGDGSHRFSNTLRAQNIAVSAYRRDQDKVRAQFPSCLGVLSVFYAVGAKL